MIITLIKIDICFLSMLTCFIFLTTSIIKTYVLGAPCLSFDVIHDNLGENREVYPLTCYIAAGTQAQRGKGNHIIVMKMSNLLRTSKAKPDLDSDEEDTDSDSEDEDEKPELETAVINHRSGCINRIRVC